MTELTTTHVDHPGFYIEEELEARGWSQVDLAYILGMSPQQLSPILKGRRNITTDMAVSLGDAFDMPPDFFINLQKQYDIQHARASDPAVRKRATWQSVYPVREMIRRGWIEDSDPDLLDLQMLRFFERNRVEDVPLIGEQSDNFAHAARKSNYEETTAVQYAWLYRVRQIAKTMETPLYLEQKLRDSLPRLRSLMIDPEEIGTTPEILHDCGVRFILVEHLPRSKIDGVCLWLDGQPVIGMTTRLDRLDNFCFVLRHEIEHVLSGHGKENQHTPVDEKSAESAYENENLPKEERIANDAAMEFCVPQDKMKSFIERKSPFISERDVLGFAARMEIHPAIVVGQIQYRTKKWNWLRKYLVGVRKHLSGWRFRDGWGEAVPVLL